MTINSELSNDAYKCAKIGELIPAIVESISELEEIDDFFKLSFELKTSKRTLKLIVIKESYTEQEIEEFRERLYNALMALGAGLKSQNIKPMDEIKKVSMVNVLVDIVGYQDDIARIASE